MSLLYVKEKASPTINLISKFCAYLAPALLPPLHIAFTLIFWSEYKREVNKNTCQCSCWDTVFKGPYESGIASYKHFYFNATNNTTKIWILTVSYLIAFYEAIRHLISLFLQNRLRYSMLILFLSSIFPHYYSFWMYVNYWNDDYYRQWYHQMFFSITELISTVFVIKLADTNNKVTPWLALGITGIAILHILTSGFDQFISNVIANRGENFQILRDLGFMLPDILHSVLPLVELRLAKRWTPNQDGKKILCILVLVISGFIFASFL